MPVVNVADGATSDAPISIDAASPDATKAPVEAGAEAKSTDANFEAESTDATFQADGSTDGSNVAVADVGSGFDAIGTADASPESSAPHTFDGTSGKACSSNADCGSINICSNTYSGQLGTLNGVVSPQFWPTPLCMLPLSPTAGVGNCNPGPDGAVEFCDTADPSNPTSPGICLPLTTPQQSGPTNGFCVPHCTFAPDGSPAVGCPGKDTCVPYTFVLDGATDVVSGHGYCQGTCQADSDCSALGTGWLCETDDGFCTKTKKARTKLIGAVCSLTPAATSDSETGACNCPFSGTADAFYCTSTCVVGGVACPNGWVCDALEPGGPIVFSGAASDGGDVVLPALSKQNPGLAGLCFAPCGNADAAPTRCPGASNIPPLSICTASADVSGTAAGSDCLP
jgi:hypothetical protein